MHINGFALPDDFLQDVAAGRFHRVMGSWPLREERDAYGNHLETELATVYATPEAITHRTKALPDSLQPDEFYGHGEDDGGNTPGFIPDITDFAQIVCFGASFDDAPFCFDFRDASESPSVIWWDDVYWRRIAPNYRQFIELFDMG